LVAVGVAALPVVQVRHATRVEDVTDVEVAGGVSVLDALEIDIDL